MNENKGLRKRILNKAWELQHRFEKRFSNMKPLEFREYLLFVAVICFIMGFVLFFYCVLLNINIFTVQIMENPLFYLVLGVIVYVLYLIERLSTLS